MSDSDPPFPEVLLRGSDPVGSNPFPPAHPAHERWARATRDAEEHAFRLDADFLSAVAVDLIDLNAKVAGRIIALFDIWTVRGINVVFIEPMLCEFDVWVGKYAEACLDMGKKSFRGPDRMRAAAEAHLQRELMAKLGHWKAEARRFLREAQASIEPAAPPAASAEDAEPAAPPADETGTPAVAVNPKKIGGPNFAEWLKQRMEARTLTVRGLSTLSEADSKTINRLLEGARVRADVVGRIVSALGAKISDCPHD